MYINIDIYTNSHSFVNHHLYVLIHLEEILKEKWENYFKKKCSFSQITLRPKSYTIFHPKKYF